MEKKIKIHCYINQSGDEDSSFIIEDQYSRIFLQTDNVIDEAWNKMLLGIPFGNLETLLLAKNNYRTFLLSNNNAIHYDWILKYLLAEFQLSNGMADYFEKDYYSH